jgi:hypothetical protein
MEYHFNMNSKEKIKTESQLINQLHCDETCTNLFIEMFEENWSKMQSIVNILYNAASK